MAKLSFSKVSKLTKTGLTEGRIYFESSTGIIHVATNETTTQEFGVGVKKAEWDESSMTLTITNQDAKEIEISFADVASASSVSAELAKKLNIGQEGDDYTAQSYYGLKAYTDKKIAEIPAAIKYKGDGTTITQSGSGEVTFAVGAVPMSKVTGLEEKLEEIEESADAAVKSVSGTAAQYITANTSAGAVTVGATIQSIDGASSSAKGLAEASDVKAYVDSAVGSVYKVKGSVKSAEALTALEDVVIGDVYNVEDAGELNGEKFEAGSNFVATKAGNGNQANMWDKLGGTIDLSAYAKKADLKYEDEAEDHQFITEVNETNGVISVNRRGLVADDIPNLPVTKITGLSTTLEGYVPTTRTVNDHALGSDVTLDGSDIKLTGYQKGTDSGNIAATDTVNAAIAKLENRVASAESGGVSSIGGKDGQITLRGGLSADGSVNLTITDSKEIQASIVGLGTAAFEDADDFEVAGAADEVAAALKGSTGDSKDATTIAGAKAYAKDYADSLAGNYATKAQGAKADTALQGASGDEYVSATKSGTNVVVAATTAALSGTTDGLVTAADARTYIADKISTANEISWVEFN